MLEPCQVCWYHCLGCSRSCKCSFSIDSVELPGFVLARRKWLICTVNRIPGDQAITLYSSMRATTPRLPIMLSWLHCKCGYLSRRVGWSDLSWKVWKILCIYVFPHPSLRQIFHYYISQDFGAIFRNLSCSRHCGDIRYICYIKFNCV